MAFIYVHKLIRWTDFIAWFCKSARIPRWWRTGSVWTSNCESAVLIYNSVKPSIAKCESNISNTHFVAPLWVTIRLMHRLMQFSSVKVKLKSASPYIKIKHGFCLGITKWLACSFKSCKTHLIKIHYRLVGFRLYTRLLWKGAYL